MKDYQILSYSGSDPALEPYRNMIYAFFKKSLRDGNDWFYDIDAEAFREAYNYLIDSLLRRPMLQVKLAVVLDEPLTCLGFSLCEEEILHYIFVKQGIDARHHGIGTDLLPEKLTTITHLTKIGRQIWKKKYPEVKFNPFV